MPSLPEPRPPRLKWQKPWQSREPSDQLCHSESLQVLADSEILGM